MAQFACSLCGNSVPGPAPNGWGSHKSWLAAMPDSTHFYTDSRGLQRWREMSVIQLTSTSPDDNRQPRTPAQPSTSPDDTRQSRQPSTNSDDNRQPRPPSSSQSSTNGDDPRSGAGWADAINNASGGGRGADVDHESSSGSAGGNSTSSGSHTYIPPRDTRTQNQKIADMDRSLNSAKQAAAGGNPGPLQDFDRMFSVTRDPREYKRAFYADYSSDKLSSATETEIRNWFAGHDTNNDGLVQTSEMTDNARSVVGGHTGSDNALSVAEGVDYHVGKIGNIDEKLDASGLPEPTKREIRNWFVGLDKNNDGAVGSSEMGAPALAINTEAGYMADNSLSVDEAIAYHKNRQAGMETKLANSGLSRDAQGHIRDYFLANDANRDGQLTQNEMAHPNHWVVNGSAITQDGKYTLEESINLHRGREGKRALTNEEIAGTALSFGNDTPTANLDPIRSVTQASAPVIPEDSPVAPITIDNGGVGPDLPGGGVIPNPTLSSPAPVTSSTDIDRYEPNETTNNKPVATAAPTPKTNDQLLASSGLSTARKNEIKTWWNGQDANKDNFIQKNEMGAYAQKENAAALADGKLTMQEAIKYHQDRDFPPEPAVARRVSSTTPEPPKPVPAAPAPIRKTKPATTTTVKPKTNDQLLASSGLSTARKNEIKTWWNGQDANKDNFIQKNEMGAYAQKENAAALADGKLSMDEAITYHQKRDKVGKYSPNYRAAATTSYGGRGTNLTPSMPASAVKPTNNASGFSLIGT